MSNRKLFFNESYKTGATDEQSEYFQFELGRRPAEPLKEEGAQSIAPGDGRER